MATLYSRAVPKFWTYWQVFSRETGVSVVILNSFLSKSSLIEIKAPLYKEIYGNLNAKHVQSRNCWFSKLERNGLTLNLLYWNSHLHFDLNNVDNLNITNNRHFFDQSDLKCAPNVAFICRQNLRSLSLNVDKRCRR